MRDLQIQLSIVDFLSVIDVHIWKKVNEHGWASIKGIIACEDETVLFRKTQSQDYAVLFMQNDDRKQKNLFAGVIERIQVENVGNVKTAEVFLKGATMLMDTIPYTRSFQNCSMSYQQLLDKVNGDYGNVSCFMGCGKGAAINQLIVQYNETNWEFIKRLASHFYQPIVPHYEEQGIDYSFGLTTGGGETQIEVISYQVGCDLSEFQTKEENQVPDIFVSDFQYYEVKSREYIELGQKVSFQGKELYVYGMESSYEGNELIHKYTLRRKGGFSVEKQYNTKLIGASLPGAILDVKKDTVKVKLDADAKQDVETAQWFPYSTVYSSADGTGWYCMPEKQDKVRLYFPNEREEEGYIISSINESGGVASKSVGLRSNPDNKSIANKYQKQIELTPTSITLTNNKGISICLDDEEGINIISDKKVKIESKEELSIKCAARFEVEAMSSIQLVQGNTKLKMEDEITVEGARFKVQ